MKLRNSQRGLTVTAVVLWSIVIILGTVVGMKVVPDVVEYTKIVSDIKAVSKDPALKTAPVQEVRMALQRRLIVNQVSAVTPQDIEIAISPEGPTLSFSYEKRIKLGGPVSLVIDFAGSSDQ